MEVLPSSSLKVKRKIILHGSVKCFKSNFLESLHSLKAKMSVKKPVIAKLGESSIADMMRDSCLPYQWRLFTQPAYTRFCCLTDSIQRVPFPYYCFVISLSLLKPRALLICEFCIGFGSLRKRATSVVLFNALVML